jgi:hypothetical protein
LLLQQQKVSSTQATKPIQVQVNLFALKLQKRKVVIFCARLQPKQFEDVDVNNISYKYQIIILKNILLTNSLQSEFVSI